MTTTDRAFIAAFQRETPPAVGASAQAPSLGSPARSLPGAGIEVVSFAVSQRPLAAEVPRAKAKWPSPVDSATAAPRSPHKFILHGPHPRPTPITTLRRPLSSFTQSQSELEEFRPAVVLPRLKWPAVCTQLGAENSDRLTTVLDALGRVAGTGTKVIGVAGTRLGGGCTTVTLALARQAARLGRRVALLEADATSPSFDAQLGLTGAQGLADLLKGQATLPQIATYAHDDRVAAIAWGDSPAIELDGRQRLQLSLAAGRLRFAFDLVLLDLGTSTPGDRSGLDIVEAMHGDALLLVVSDLCPPGRLAEIQEQLESSGRPLLGIIENAASSDL
ncbi:MAG: hypothetical protein WD851_20910 [Pirellulales bacterium]